MERVGVYFDGFNLYHALRGLKDPHLKWVNLQKLSKLLIKSKSQQIVHVKYFSAFANHLGKTSKADSLSRHRAYVSALQAKGVQCIMGNFAKRDRQFNGVGYRARWRRFEEKQTDVGIAVHLISDAYRDLIDHAYLVSLDTDMLPAFEMFKQQFPNKNITCVAPPSRQHHGSIQAIVPVMTIKRSQIEKALFGARIVKDGTVVATRPAVYKPPS